MIPQEHSEPVLSRLRGRVGRRTRQLVLAAVLGSLMSGVALAFIRPIEYGFAAFGQAAGRASWLLVVIPALGGLLSGWLYELLRTPGEGKGVSRIMWSIYRKRGRLPALEGLRTWLASSATIATGGSAGPEGPIAAIGSVIGSQLAKLFRLPPRQMTTLLGCGAAAGISSVFNTPIAGVFFVTEVMLRDLSSRTFAPIVVAAVVSTAITQSVAGGHPLFPTPQDFGDGAFGWWEIPNYLLLGLLCGAGAAGFGTLIGWVGSTFRKIHLGTPLRASLGGLLLGTVAFVWHLIASDATDLPPFLGKSYDQIRILLEPLHYEGQTWRFVGLLILIGVAKGMATAVTFGSGGSGGLFAPSLFMGAAVGGAFGFLVEQVGWLPSASPAHYALVGMGAMVAGTTHAPLTAIFLAYEITRSCSVMLPLMLAAVLAVAIARALRRDSVYTASLSRAGIRLGPISDLGALRSSTPADLKLVAPVFVHPDETAERLLALSSKLHIDDFVVVDRKDRYVGLVTSEDLREALVYREALPLLQVEEMMRPNLPTVAPEEPLDEVLDRFVQHDVHTLAVVDPVSKSVMGLASRLAVMGHYHRASHEEEEGDDE